MSKEIIISNHNGEPVASSLEVARNFDKRHDHVIRDIEKILMTPNLGALQKVFFETVYTDSRGRKKKCYEMTKDGFMLLAMGFSGQKALAWKLKYIQAFNEMEKALTNRQDCGIIKNKNECSFEWYENISALPYGDTSINTYAKALDLADYSITQLSALVKYLLRKSARNEEFFIMDYGKFDLDTLKSCLPQYLSMITQHRKGKQYNCPFCGSGTGKNGTPALNTYDNSTKWKCQSCGAGGDIINLFYMVNQLTESPENFRYAVKTLSEQLGLPEPAFLSEPTKKEKPHKIGERQHIYYNADGSVFGMKVITMMSDGSKRPCWYLYDPETNSYSIGLQGQKAPLYNAHILHNMSEETVFITEGEKDADTVSNMDGIPATTIPNGAGFTQWLDIYNDGLQGKDIIILTDNDEAGKNYGMKVAQNTLNIAKSVKIIPATAIWEKCPPKGDISDIVQAIGEDEATQLLADAIHKTPFCTLELLQTIEENATSTINQHKIVYHTIKLSEVESEKQEFLWNPYIPIGEITVMFAAGGTGKSYATIGITADVTAGRTLPKYGEKPTTTTPAKVLIISAEDTASTIKNRMQEIGGNPDNCILLKTPKNLLELHEDSFLLPQDKDDTAHIEAFSNLLKEIKPKLIIIDPWSVYIGNDKNMNKSNDMRGITTVLTTLAKEYHCAILIVAHVNKMPQMENANNAVSGSTALIDAARSALCVRSFGADSDRRVIIQTKANYSHKGKAVCYRIIDQGEGKTARFQWDGFCDLTEDDLTASARSGKKLTDIASEKEEDSENTAVIVDVITKLAKPNEKIPISYNRLRSEIIENCGVDFLGGQPKKEMYKALSDLHTRGIGLEFPVGTVRGFAKDGKREERNRGFYICCLTDGHLMAEAMPK